ncbi:MAG: acyltransferase [Chitinophagaceae bacterium]
MKVYFKNLDGIRFIAALLVILQHTSDYKSYQQIGLPNTLEKQLGGVGGLGVTLFFVLSGFLIFFLLFSEQKLKQTISIKNFYIRRILRIWPLYFGFGLLLIIGINYFLSIDTPVLKNLFFLGTFSINLQLLFSIPNKGIIELYWSVCIEEQFYLVAPWLVKKGVNRMLLLILILIGIGMASRILFYYLATSAEYNFHGNDPVYFFTLCRFDNFGFGALAALLYFEKSIYQKIQPIVENKIVQAVVVLFTFLYVFNLIPHPGWFIASTLPSILFAFIILSASTGNFILNLENAVMKRLGKYSYGIYIFHAIICQFIITFFLKYLPGKTIFNYDILYPLCCVVATAIVAGISYELYERHFLKLKQRFTIVKNHDV